MTAIAGVVEDGKVWIGGDSAGVGGLSFHSCGCGSDIVLGSLHATNEFELEPKPRINMALRAAMEFCAGVRGPFTIVSV